MTCGYQVFKGKLLDAIKTARLTLPVALPDTWVVDCHCVGDGQKALLYRTSRASTALT